MLSLVIPCYNESANIPLIVKTLSDMLNEEPELEILLVDNGSTDKSAVVLTSAINDIRNPKLRQVYVPVNQGYGHGILQGLENAQGDVLAWTHADLQTDPRDCLVAYRLLLSQTGQNHIVKGKRLERALAERIFTFGMQLVASLALGVTLDDINAQPKVFHRRFYEEAIRPTAPKDFSLDLFLLYQARKMGLNILSVPVMFAKRLHGEAKGGGSFKTRIKLIRRTFTYIFHLRNQLKNVKG